MKLGGTCLSHSIIFQPLRFQVLQCGRPLLHADKWPLGNRRQVVVPSYLETQHCPAMDESHRGGYLVCLYGLPMEYASSPIIVRTLGSMLGEVVAISPMDGEDFNIEYASVKVMINFCKSLRAST